MAQTRKTSTKSSSTKTASAKSGAKTNTKTAKTSKNAVNSKSTSGSASKIILGIIIGVSLVVCIIFAICKITTSNDNSDSTSEVNTPTLENGKGDKIDAKYVGIENYDYEVLVPSKFKSLSGQEMTEIYGDDSAADLVYSNDDHSVNIAFSKPEEEINNDEMQEYLDAMKTVFGMSGEILGSELYEVNGHKVGNIRLVTEYSDEKLYNDVVFFPYDGKLAIISFNCKDETRSEWEKVGEGIIKSLKINQ